MLIGISGKAQSGKNTVADMLLYLYFYYLQSGYQNFISFKNYYQNESTNHEYLEGSYGEGTDRYFELYQWSFGHNLKRCLADCCNVNIQKFEDNEFKQSKVPWLDLTYRELLQKFGTAIRKEVSDTFWVESLFTSIPNEPKIINLITDVRFKSEANAIKNKGGILIRVNRPGAGAGNHISETELDNYPNFDYVIENVGNLEDLFKSVNTMFQYLINE